MPTQPPPRWTWRHPLLCLSVSELDAFTPPGVLRGDATVSTPTLDFQVWAGSHQVKVMQKLIRVVATTPEKTHNQKFLTFETILNRFLVQFYPGLKKKKKKKKKKLPPLYIDQLKCGIRPPTPPPPDPPDAFWGTTL